MDLLSSSGSSIRGGYLFAVLAFLLAIPASVAAGDESREQSLKAGYVFNFIRYVSWPTDVSADPNEPFRICFYGDEIPSDAFDSLDGRKLPNADAGDSAHRETQVRQAAGPADIAGCQVLYVGNDRPPKASEGLLIVGDGAEFVQSGGMIGLFKKKNRLGFSINLAEARGKGLNIRSELLKLATNVIQ